MKKENKKPKLTTAQKIEIATHEETIELLKRIATGSITYKKKQVVKGELVEIDVYPTISERRQAMVALNKILTGKAVKGETLLTTKTIRIEFVDPTKD